MDRISEIAGRVSWSEREGGKRRRCGMYEELRLKVGDLVDAGAYGKLWVTAQPDSETVWVSDDEEDVRRGLGRGLRRTFVKRVLRRAGRTAASPAMSEAMKAADAIWDGMAGMVSEEGRFPDRYWKRSVERLYKTLKRSGVAPMEMVQLLDELIDGLEGVDSEGRYPGGYWRPGTLERASRAREGLLAELRRR